MTASPRRARTKAVVAAVVLAVLAAACSSGKGRGVDVQALLRGDGRDSAATGGTAASGASGAAGPDSTGVTSGSASNPANGPAGSPSATGGTSTSTRSSVAAAPATGGTVKIGLHISANLQAAYAAFGAKNAGGDITPALHAVVDWINAHGGMHGRKVEPIFHASDPLHGTFDSEAQAACADFADDQHVFAVVSGAVLPTPVTPDCLAKKHIPLVWDYHFIVDGPMWSAYMPYLYMPFSVSADRMGFYIDQLAADNYFAPDARVAIVRYDVPEHARLADQILRPRLAAHKVNVVDEIAVSRPPSATAAADVGSQISNAILRMRSENVTHVLFVPTGGAVPFLFMSEAEAQGFRPRYAMNSLDIPYFVADQAPAKQLHGALAIGWSPASDVHHDQQPSPVNASSALCYSLTKTDDAARYCDGLFFLKAAMDRATTFDAAGLQAAVEAMGTSFDPVFSLADRFGPNRHDGASAVRLVAYDDGCSCFRYAGPLVPID